MSLVRYPSRIYLIALRKRRDTLLEYGRQGSQRSGVGGEEQDLAGQGNRLVQDSVGKPYRYSLTLERI